jgi:hypothetical protein
MRCQALLHETVNRHRVPEIVHDQQVGLSTVSFQFGQCVYAIVENPNEITAWFKEHRVQVEYRTLIIDRVN